MNELDIKTQLQLYIKYLEERVYTDEKPDQEMVDYLSAALQELMYLDSLENF